MPAMENTIIQVMQDFRKGRSIQALSKATKISRITLNSWSRGHSVPSLGVLLEHYFTGTPEGIKLADTLIYNLYPKVVRFLPDKEIIINNFYATLPSTS